MKRWKLLLGCVMVLASCHKREAPVPPPVKPKPPATLWHGTSLVDPMTDKVLHMMRIDDADGDGHLTLGCDDDGERLAVSSELFLGAGQVGKVLFRYDDAKPLDWDAQLNEKTALFARPHGTIDIKREDIRRAIFEFQSAAAIMYLRAPHRRLRVRLTAFDGEQRDLDFNITGNEPLIAAMEKKCGIPNYRPGQ